MVFNVETKYNIGDKLKIYHYIPWRGFGCESLEVSHIRVIYDNGTYIPQYFFKGLDSYEGENWFNELDDPKNIACSGGIVEDPIIYDELQYWIKYYNGDDEP